MINKNNIRAYLLFFGDRIKMDFPEESLRQWESFDDGTLRINLNTLYARLGMQMQDCHIREAEFVVGQKTPELKNAEPVIIPDRNEKLITKPEVVAEPDVPLVQDVYNQANYDRITNKFKNRNRFLLGILLLVIFGSLSAFFAYNYKVYSSMGYAYCLADNAVIRSASNEQSAMIGRMDLFGQYMNVDGRVIISYDILKVISTETENAYTKIQVKESFWDYLTNNESNVAYCHSAFLTSDGTLFSRYREIFKELKDDFNEMDKLQYIYRKIIVSAIHTYSDLKDLTVKGSCYKEKKLSDKAMVGIGQFKSKDELGNTKSRYAIVQLSDDQYYTIQATKEGDVDSLWYTQFKDNGELIPMKSQGKFKYYDPYKFTYGDFIWESCDKSERAISTQIPFNIFVKQ